ncbi:MAG: polymerase [Acidiphilium sp. 21-60-14]|nr:MAG: polymerase [Acidiphilium sp. 21-60-14]OYV91995.1 MAG: polymerase [Acidiphilium sp. 37-60-79]OZB39307.1 MAG: polymerase [Acidiphilium sp. 34-60-192]
MTSRRDPIWVSSMLLGLGLSLVAVMLPPWIARAELFLALLVLAALAYAKPVWAMVAWLVAVQSSPEMWLSDLIGQHELIIAVLKAAGLAVMALAAWREGARFDRYNPGFAFGAMFVGGIVHGFWPGLTLLASVRSLIGSAAPFGAGFIKLSAPMRRAIIRVTIAGPVLTVLFGAVLDALGVRAMVGFEQGALRLAAASSPAFLGGFAMIGVYAGILAYLRRKNPWLLGWIGLDLLVLVATGARAPLGLAAFVLVATLVAVPSTQLSLQRRMVLLSLLVGSAGLMLLVLPDVRFIRVIDLWRLGEAGDLSNRTLIWPAFERAIAASPWLGWGVGAGKVVVNLHSSLGELLGTNAAHCEYLRIPTEGGFIGAALLVALLVLWVWRGSAKLPRDQRIVIRLVFFAFAVQSVTDNTLIATTSLAFFTWARAVLVFADESVS